MLLQILSQNTHWCKVFEYFVTWNGNRRNKPKRNTSNLLPEKNEHSFDRVSIHFRLQVFLETTETKYYNHTKETRRTLHQNTSNPVCVTLTGAVVSNRINPYCDSSQSHSFCTTPPVTVIINGHTMGALKCLHEQQSQLPKTSNRLPVDANTLSTNIPLYGKVTSISLVSITMIWCYLLYYFSFSS